jgi:hypothetical protein
MSDIIKPILSKTNSTLLKVVAFSTSIIAIVGIYNLYKNEVWSPKVVVDNVDFDNGVANLTIGGRKFVLRGDSTYLISNDWGIRFGYTYINGNRSYDRIELTKRGMVEKVIK